MEKFFVTPDEIVDILKKRYEKRKNNGEEIDENKISSKEINEFIIEYELEKFYDLFTNVFDDNEDILSINKENNLDSEDGIKDTCLEIVSRIKEKLEKVDKLKLLNFIFKLIKSLILKEEDDA